MITWNKLLVQSFFKTPIGRANPKFMGGVPVPAKGGHVQSGAILLARFALLEAATRPTSGDSFHGFGPGTNPADGVGSFDVAGSYCAGSGDGGFRSHATQQSHEEPR